MPRPIPDPLAVALDAIPGTVSVWCGPVGRPAAWLRLPDTTHYAASTMKLAVMVAAYQLADAGRLDLDTEVAVRDDFASATGGRPYVSHPDYDNDEQPWARLGGTATLRWLIRRMIVKSSNLATNLVLTHIWAVDTAAVAEVWRAAGARASVTGRGIEDYAAQAAGVTNLVTAADLAALLAALRMGHLAAAATTTEMIDVLLAQQVTDDIVRGLPPETRVAHKNGWVEGIHHSAALVMPDDAAEFVLVTCVSASIEGQEGRDLLAHVAAAAWSDRHRIGSVDS